MIEDDELIGKNIARLREPRSQADVAKAMRARGWKWQQNTVSAVENGERPLRLAEAIDLARVLNVGSGGVETFARESEWVTVKLWASAAFEAHRDLIKAAEAYREAQVNLAVAGDHLDETGVKMTNEVIGPLTSWLKTSATTIVLRSVLDSDDHDATRTREFVASVREGHEERGANGRWMNALFDTDAREAMEALEELDGEHQEEA